MLPTALRNRCSGRLLRVETKTEDYSDWGYDGVDEKYSTHTKAVLELNDSQYEGVKFMTDDPDLLATLLKEGASSFPELSINFGHGADKFTLEDLVPVTLVPA